MSCSGVPYDRAGCYGLPYSVSTSDVSDVPLQYRLKPERREGRRRVLTLDHANEE